MGELDVLDCAFDKQMELFKSAADLEERQLCSGGDLLEVDTDALTSQDSVTAAAARHSASLPNSRDEAQGLGHVTRKGGQCHLAVLVDSRRFLRLLARPISGALEEEVDLVEHGRVS